MLEPRLILIHLLDQAGRRGHRVDRAWTVEGIQKTSLSRKPLDPDKIYLALWMGLPIALGVWIRFNVTSFISGDLSLETALLLGVIGGRLSGGVGGALIALPAALHDEWASMPLYVLAGIVAGQLRQFAPEQEDIWSFSPFVDLTIFAGFAAICRARACLTGRSLFS